MSTNETPAPEAEQKRFGLDPLAALLSYLIPGLGQIYQARFLKGILFLICLWGLFFYGLYLGNWQNVYFPPQTDAQGQVIPNHGDLWLRSPLITNIVGRPIHIPHVPYLAQFCIGIAAWPAIIQANSYDLNEVTKIEPEKTHPFLGNFERYPNQKQQEIILRNGDKRGDLGWVYTIIAGLLNLLVIYDALAGPAHGTHAVPLTTFLWFLVALTVACAIGLGVLVFLTLTHEMQPSVYLQLPIVLALVSLVYSATRFERWRAILLEAVHWGWRMTAFLLAIGAVLYVVARPPLMVFGGW
jgi:TM2 domain-containing membrane protein YozV